MLQIDPSIPLKRFMSDLDFCRILDLYCHFIPPKEITQQCIRREDNFKRLDGDSAPLK